MAPTPCIEFRDVTLEVEGRRILDRANFMVRCGESVVVAGLPGCGKSFVLRLILGLPGLADTPVMRWGEVTVGGESVFELNGTDLQHLRRRIGSVMYNGGLIENMDIRRNIGLPIQYHYRDALADGSIADRRCDRLLCTFGIADLGATGVRPVSLNREQRIYVSLARALVVEPFLLLFDDPVLGLSPAPARRLLQHVFADQPPFGDDLRTAVDTALTRVITTVDLNNYLSFGDRFVLLHNEQLTQIGDRDAVEGSDDPGVRSLFRAVDNAPLVDRDG